MKITWRTASRMHLPMFIFLVSSRLAAENILVIITQQNQRCGKLTASFKRLLHSITASHSRRPKQRVYTHPNRAVIPLICHHPAIGKTLLTLHNGPVNGYWTVNRPTCTYQNTTKCIYLENSASELTGEKSCRRCGRFMSNNRFYRWIRWCGLSWWWRCRKDGDDHWRRGERWSGVMLRRVKLLIYPVGSSSTIVECHWVFCTMQR